MAEAVSRPNFPPSKCLATITTDHPHPPRQVAFPLSRNKPSPASFSLTFTPAPSLPSSSNSRDYYFRGRNRVVFLGGKRADPNQTILPSRLSSSISAQMNTGIGIGKAQRWWEKGIQPNMKEVMGAQDLVDSLLTAGDKLVVVDFYSPGCGGCKALHPKICQLAEMNPDVVFLEVNYETHKSMCYSLNVHVLPFFRFYRGAHGRLCSFSCTNATMKKFKDALGKYGADFCSLEPTKGLEEKELVALAANRDLSFSYTSRSKPEPPERPIPISSTSALHLEPNPEKRTLISSGR